MASKISCICIIFSLISLNAQQNQPADSIFKANANETDLAKRFSVLDSLSLALEGENYVNPYEKVQLELIDLGIKIDSIDRVAYQGIGLSWFYNNIQRQPKKSIDLNKKLLNLDSSQIRKFYRGLLHRELADAYFFSGENLKAIEEYEKAVGIFTALENEQVLAETLMYLSAPQSNIGDFVSSITTMNRSLKLFEQTGDKYNITGMRIEMALLYNKYGFQDEANAQYQTLIDEGFANNAQLSSVYINKANIANSNNEIENYFDFLDLAEEFAKESDRSRFILPAILLSKAKVFFSQNEVEKGNEMFAAFEENYIESKSSFYSEYTTVKAERLISGGEIEEAIKELETLLEIQKSRKNWSKVVKTHKKLVELYQEVGKNQQALENQTQYVILKDSIEADKKILRSIFSHILFLCG